MITYTVAEYTSEETSVEVTFTNAEGLVHKRNVNIPRDASGSVDEEAFNAQKENIRTRLLNQKSQRFFTEWYEQLKEKADIEDNRYMFFAS